MLKQEKKRLGKVKDRLIHAANDLREIGGADGIGDGLIDVINKLQEHINGASYDG